MFWTARLAKPVVLDRLNSLDRAVIYGVVTVSWPPSCSFPSCLLSLAFKGSRQHLAFRYNIFEHLGAVSTLRGKASPTYPKCFEELTTQTLFEVSPWCWLFCLGRVCSSPAVNAVRM